MIADVVYQEINQTTSGTIDNNTTAELNKIVMKSSFTQMVAKCWSLLFVHIFPFRQDSFLTRKHPKRRRRNEAQQFQIEFQFRFDFDFNLNLISIQCEVQNRKKEGRKGSSAHCSKLVWLRLGSCKWQFGCFAQKHKRTL